MRNDFALADWHKGNTWSFRHYLDIRLLNPGSTVEHLHHRYYECDTWKAIDIRAARESEMCSCKAQRLNLSRVLLHCFLFTHSVAHLYVHVRSHALTPHTHSVLFGSSLTLTWDKRKMRSRTCHTPHLHIRPPPFEFNFPCLYPRGFTKITHRQRTVFVFTLTDVLWNISPLPALCTYMFTEKY